MRAHRHLRPAALAAACALAATGCVYLVEPDEVETGDAFGMRPVYADTTEAFAIASEPARAFADTRGFLVIGDTLYVVEHLAGVHVVDNRQPAAPSTVAFLSVPGCTSVAARGAFLYVNNYQDLVTLDVRDVTAVVEVDRERDLYPAPLASPENYFGRFECYDPARGLLVGWEEDELDDPQCRTGF